ncbi:hypothetical protein VTP01DRAFT_6842 [Rhizomucor pusillus]|uniref:uncharacterized protein n=1 Tax=Rhizomucor pusillus TaxID=4840 RepID=UPI00374325F5
MSAERRDDYRRMSRSRSRSPSTRRSRDDRHRERSPSPRRSRSRDRCDENTGTTLYVSGLSLGVTENDLTDLFDRYGKVSKAVIVMDPHTRESRGFGFVDMATLEDADKAIDALHDSEFKGRIIRVEKSKRSRPRTPTPGRYRGVPPRRDYPSRRYSRGYSPSRYRDDYYYSRSRARDDRYYDDQRDRYERDRRDRDRSPRYRR